MRVYCFYHRADLDGHCSAAIVRLWCKRHGHEFVPRGVNYGEEIDWLAGADENAMAVVCDFTPEGNAPAVTLGKIWEKHGKGLVWIDHHKTAIAAVGSAGREFAGAREVDTAACVLAWHYFFKGEARPVAVTWLGKYDVFDRTDMHMWEGAVLPFQYGMRLHKTNPDGSDEPGLWKVLLADPLGIAASHIASAGETCLKYERAQNARSAKSAAYDCEFEGLLCCAVNVRGNSLVLDSYARPEHRMRVLWGFAGGRWRVSLYENGHDDVDCGEVAKRHGGGGHKGAAGFELPAHRCPLELFWPVKRETTELHGKGAGND